MLISNSYPVRVMNNLQGLEKGDSVVECRGERKEEEEEGERKKEPLPMHPLELRV